MDKDCEESLRVGAEGDTSLLNVLPFALLECTCDTQPRVLRASEQAFRYLKAEEYTGDWSSCFGDNLLLLPCFEERVQFRALVGLVTKNSTNRECGVRLLGFDGTEVPVRAWMRVTQNARGEDRLLFSFVPRKESDTERRFATMVLDALKASFNVIFEVDLSRGTAECVYGKDTSDIGSIFGVCMTTSSAKAFWLDNYVHFHDRQALGEYLDVVCSSQLFEQRERPLQLEFRVDWRDGRTYAIIASAVALSDTVVLIGCRNISSLHFKGLTSASERAFSRMFACTQDLLEADMGALGLLRFHLRRDRVIFHYISPYVAELLGVPEGEVVRILNTGMSRTELERRVGRFGIGLEALLEAGDSVVSQRRSGGTTLRLACRSYTCGEGERLYSVYVYDHYAKSATDSCKNGIFIRTFGRFDVFVRGSALVFSSQKEKELMALLADRRGGTLQSVEACELLWPGEPVDSNLKARYRKLAMNLKRTLEKAECPELLVSKRGVKSVDMGKATCDCEEYFRGNPHYQGKYCGAYMIGYDWARDTREQLERSEAERERLEEGP